MQKFNKILTKLDFFSGTFFTLYSKGDFFSGSFLTLYSKDPLKQNTMV